MNTNERPTPESDKEEEFLDSGWGCLGDTFRTMRRLERERDEAREKLAELEKQLAPLQKPKKPETFEAHGLTWIKRTPGDPMPCDADAPVRVLFGYEKHGEYRPCTKHALVWDWDSIPKDPDTDIIGWNYADTP